MLVKHPRDRFNRDANQIFRSQNHRSTDCNSITSAKSYNKTLQSRYQLKIATRYLFKKAPLKRNVVFICVLFFQNMTVEPAFLICQGILTNSYRHRTNGLLTNDKIKKSNECLTVPIDGSKRTNYITSFYGRWHHGLTDRRPITLRRNCPTRSITRV